MKPEFEHNFQKKVMFIRFPEPTRLNSVDDIREWRQLWTKELGSWHSPYKALIDCHNLQVEGSPQMADEWKRFEAFLKGFFLREAYTFNCNMAAGHQFMPFQQLEEEEALRKAGLKRTQLAQPGDFRSLIHIENHFQQHVVELSFAQHVLIDSEEQVATLKSKLTNNLMQWHTGWNLLIDCSLLEIQESQFASFEAMIRYFKSFFLKEILGYSPKSANAKYPFKAYRARHNAAGRLESEGLISGGEANCNSRKEP